MMSCPVIVKIIRDDSKTFLIDGTDWIIPSDGLEGFGEVSNDLSTIENAIGDGSVIVNKRVSSAERTIKARVVNPGLNQTLRHMVTAFFNGKHSFKIFVTYMGRTRWCDGEIEKFICPTINIYQPVSFVVTFLSANPFMKSDADFGKNIAGVIPMAAFPYLCTEKYGRPTGRFAFARKVLLFNDGDTETYCKAVFLAKGEVKNPKLIINGKYVRVITDMHDKDVLVIDFTKDPPTVRMNGKNIIGRTDRTSTFDDMALIIGDSEVSFDSDSGSSLLDVSIYYNKLYNAI